MTENKNIEYSKDGIPIIKFMKHPHMSGLVWSDATPAEYGGSGIPIPEHREVHDKCKKEGTKFYWKIASGL